MTEHPTSSGTIRFSRHAGACLAAAALGTTVYTIIVMIQIGWAGRLGAGLVLLPVLWVGAFIMALTFAGFWLTLVWPVLRLPQAQGGIIAPLAAAAGAIAINGGSALILGRPTSLASLTIFASLGAVTGAAYWWIVRRR